MHPNKNFGTWMTFTPYTPEMISLVLFTMLTLGLFPLKVCNYHLLHYHSTEGKGQSSMQTGLLTNKILLRHANNRVNANGVNWVKVLSFALMSQLTGYVHWRHFFLLRKKPPGTPTPAALTSLSRQCQRSWTHWKSGENVPQAGTTTEWEIFCRLVK